MVQGFSLGNYQLLVDLTARLYREGKATLSRDVAEILDRLRSRVEHWQARLEKLRQGRLLSRFFATTRQHLRAVAERLGLRRVPNLGGCPASWDRGERGRAAFARVHAAATLRALGAKHGPTRPDAQRDATISAAASARRSNSTPDPGRPTDKQRREVPIVSAHRLAPEESSTCLS
jgi:hypothetical protein